MQLTQNELVDLYQDLRTERKYKTQTSLAKDIGLNVKTITALENGRPISANTLIKYADFFGVSTDYLLGRTSVKSPDPNIQAASELFRLSEEALQNINPVSELQEIAFTLSGQELVVRVDDIYSNDSFAKLVSQMVKVANQCRSATEKINSVINSGIFVDRNGISIFSDRPEKKEKDQCDALINMVQVDYYLLMDRFKNLFNEVSKYSLFVESVDRYHELLDSLPFSFIPGKDDSKGPEPPK